MAIATEFTLTASYDGANQKVMYYEPAAPAGKPLVQHFHNFSGDYKTADIYQATLDACAARGWGFVSHDFRGPADSATWQTLHMGSDAVLADTADARAWALARGGYDPALVFAIGGSGGGHTALLSAAKMPTLYAGVATIVGISDLSHWWWWCVTRSAYDPPSNVGQYSTALEAIFGGGANVTAGGVNLEYRNRSPVKWLGNLLEMPVHLEHGVNDPTVPLENCIMTWNRLCAIKGYADRMLDGWEMSQLLAHPAPRGGVAFDADFTAQGGAAEPPGVSTALKRAAGNMRLVLPNSAHTGEPSRAFATFDLIVSGDIRKQTAKRIPRTPAALGQLV